MKVILNERNKYILRFDPEEDLIEQIKNFADYHNIQSGVFFGIGSVKKAVVSYYNIEDKYYEDFDVLENMELTSLIGNIAYLNGEIAVHSHGVLASANTSSLRSGHFKQLIVSGTCEVVLETFSSRMERKPDDKTGLNILD